MSEKIRELAEQSGSTHKQSLGVYQFYPDELEKFVELIIQDMNLRPLSDEAIKAIYYSQLEKYGQLCDMDDIELFALAIEAAHGIGVDNDLT